MGMILELSSEKVIYLSTCHTLADDFGMFINKDVWLGGAGSCGEKLNDGFREHFVKPLIKKLY